MHATRTTDKEKFLHNCGASLGAANVKMLREARVCSCLACQTHSLEGALRWAVHGEDLRDVEAALKDFAARVEQLRIETANELAYVTASIEAGIHPMRTDGHA